MRNRVHFIGYAIISLLWLGCGKSMPVPLPGQTGDESDYKIRASVPVSGTKVKLDGLELKWKIHDRIRVFEVLPEYLLGREYGFQISSAEDIAPDGKSAFFSGPVLEQTKRYVAFYACGGVVVSENSGTLLQEYKGLLHTYLGKNDNLIISAGGSSELLDNNLALISGAVMVGKEEPDFVFRPMESILSLAVRISPEVPEGVRLKKIRFSAPGRLFTKQGFFCNALGEAKLHPSFSQMEDHYIEIQVVGEPLLSHSRPYVVNVPVWTNLLEPEPAGEFVITLITCEGEESVVKRPFKPLVAGTLYKSDLVFPEPVNKVESDREALIAVYNQIGGPWEYQGRPVENWCSTKPLSEWSGVEVDPNGRVRWLNISCGNISQPFRIPEELGRLDCLQGLSFYGRMEGRIPESFKNLHSLNLLSIRGAEGGLSDVSVLKGLTWISYLDLSCHQLTGMNLEWLSGFKWLNTLLLYRAGFSGGLPDELVSVFPQLAGLNITKNNLSGVLPAALLDHPNWPEWMKSIVRQNGSGFEMTGVVFPFPHFEDRDVASGVVFSSREVIAKNRLTIFYKWPDNVSDPFLNGLFRLYARYHAHGLEIVSYPNVSLPGLVREYVTDNRLPWYNVWNKVQALSNAYALVGAYEVTGVDSQGNIVFDKDLISREHTPENLEVFVKGFFEDHPPAGL